MKRSIGFFLPVMLILMVVFISGSFRNLRLGGPKGAKGDEARIVFAQLLERDGKKEEKDPHYILILKQMKEKVDEWLKSLNERIEREDITRLEVRFLEILRSILEWVKEKIDAKIGSPEEKKDRGESSQETKQERREFVPPVKGILRA